MCLSDEGSNPSSSTHASGCAAPRWAALARGVSSFSLRVKNNGMMSLYSIQGWRYVGFGMLLWHCLALPSCQAHTGFKSSVSKSKVGFVSRKKKKHWSRVSASQDREKVFLLVVGIVVLVALAIILYALYQRNSPHNKGDNAMHPRRKAPAVPDPRLLNPFNVDNMGSDLEEDNEVDFEHLGEHNDLLPPL